MNSNNYVFHEKDIAISSSFPIQYFKNFLSPAANFVAPSHQPINKTLFFLDENFIIKSCSHTTLIWLQDYLKKSHNFSKNDIFSKEIHSVFDPFPTVLRAALLNALKNKSWSSEPIQHTHDNNHYWLQWEVLPHSERADVITGVAVCIKDISYQQHLLLAHKRLQYANELLESFNLIFAHDLIQPIRQIANFLDIIQEHQQESLDDIFLALQRSIEHIQSLSEGMTLYCKEGKLTAKTEKISIKKLIQEICVNALKKESFRFHYNLEDDIFVQANRTCITQLFQNLLVNAIRHSSCENTIITLSGARESKNFYKFFLHNNSDCQNLIFQKKFFSPFQSFSTEGAGLGLMICQKIISAYKGKIFFYSEKNKGTTVSFTLPAYSNEYLSHKPILKKKTKGANNDC